MRLPYTGKLGDTLSVAARRSAAPSFGFSASRTPERDRRAIFGGALIFPRLLMSVRYCLPGRESRIWEEPYTDLGILAYDLAEALAPAIDRPFAIFGHSMGALIAFALARQLRQRSGLTPLHLFASACRAPQSPDLDPPLHGLPEDEFLSRLRAMNYGPDEIYNHPQFLEILLPTVRADYCLCENYEYRSERPLECPITVFGGLEDRRVTAADLDAWSIQTAARFRRVMFPGGHLFLHHHEPAVADCIVAELDEESDNNGRMRHWFSRQKQVHSPPK